MEQVTGIEPALSAWEAEVLPLNYTCRKRIYYSETNKTQSRLNSLKCFCFSFLWYLKIMNDDIIIGKRRRRMLMDYLMTNLPYLAEAAGNGQLANLVTQIVISCVLSVLLIAVSVIVFRAWVAYVTIGVELVAANLFFFFHLDMPFYLMCFMLMITTGILLAMNRNTVRAYVSNIVSATTKSNPKKSKSKKEIDDDVFYHKITEAVQWMSDHKTGAIISFERNNSLDKYVRSGTILHCPVTPELLETIFFEGTRLHDGAVIIRNQEILAASVFFPSTNRILVGKYGARHRAALGISEVTDAVTVVVSEETGRISIACRGVLEAVKYDEFEKVLKTFMTSAFSDIETDESDAEKGTEEEDQ